MLRRRTPAAETEERYSDRLAIVRHLTLHNQYAPPAFTSYGEIRIAIACPAAERAGDAYDIQQLYHFKTST